MPAKKDNELQQSLEDVIQEGLTLQEEERELLQTRPTFLAESWNDVKDAINLRSFKPIIAAQIAKAINGDTTSAKFIIDFATPEVKVGREVEVPEWEETAIELRNALGLEISAENLVKMLLKSYSKLSPENQAKFLSENTEEDSHT